MEDGREVSHTVGYYKLQPFTTIECMYVPGKKTVNITVESHFDDDEIR